MQESGEMYLENILIIGKKSNIVRAIDIVEKTGYSKASVSKALTRLKAEECIVVGNGGMIALTEKGRQIAESMFERHIVLTRLLIALGVDEDTAEADACKMEHAISDTTFEAMKKHSIILTEKH